jgi:hypothetical protein
MSIIIGVGKFVLISYCVVLLMTIRFSFHVGSEYKMNHDVANIILLSAPC